MNTKELNKDINLFEIFTILFKNKWKIILIPSLITVLSLLYFNFNHEEKYLTVTKIYPISSDEEQKYNTYNFLTPIFLAEKKNEFENFLLVQNNQNGKNEEQGKPFVNFELSTSNLPKLSEAVFDKKFLKIDKLLLLDLFIEEIQKKEILKEEIKKSKLIDQKIYEDKLSFELTLNNLVSKISIEKKDDNLKTPEYWQIKFITSNKNSWEKVLASIEKPLNEKVRLFLEEALKNKIENFKKIKSFIIEDLEHEISNTIQSNKEKNKLRLIYLDRQAKLAREMNLQKNNNLETIQTFISDQAGTISNFRTESPYYMRGYEIIEKEIELIREREKDENILTEDIIQLQSYKKILLEEKNIDRLNTSLYQTPIINSGNFKAARIDLISTTSEKIENIRSKIIMIGLISLILTIMLVLIRNSYTNSKINI